ncbi:hypothetical protein JYU34_013091 [Plutella xylostella]|uniref:Androglobin n=1 Tax=Plutella xylostella TaxID=51655 RepID=A0ABQ7QCW5_PLUXY|nr:hypothetical protein JYU34_013091 [Plutella xylostella]
MKSAKKSPKKASGKETDTTHLDKLQLPFTEVDPTECPFREFRDNELIPELWGAGPKPLSKSEDKKTSLDAAVWTDDQVQPLPRSARKDFFEWRQAKELAKELYDAGVAVEDSDNLNMALLDVQTSYAEIIERSAFCRKFMSICYILEKQTGFVVEHQSESFTCALADGWRPKYHVYTPGLKPGGGHQHKPVYSKNGCYLVRLYYIGAWRCVWVNDLVPTDKEGHPLLPFHPIIKPLTSRIVKINLPPSSGGTVALWPLLLCKALLKLAAPDMTDAPEGSWEDEDMEGVNIFHALTGALVVTLTDGLKNVDESWELLKSEVPVFEWENDDETIAGTVKTKSTKKSGKKSAEKGGKEKEGKSGKVSAKKSAKDKKKGEKDVSANKSRTLVCANLNNTKNYEPYTLPGLVPAYEMILVVQMLRDLPLMKPLAEPELALWKYIRWIYWAKSHGLYLEHECPRTRFIKSTGLLKLSLATHLLDLQSTSSISHAFRATQRNSPLRKKEDASVKNKQQVDEAEQEDLEKRRYNEELRKWVLYDAYHQVLHSIDFICFPSTNNFFSSSSSVSRRNPRSTSKNINIPYPTDAPLYLVIHGKNAQALRVALTALHPRVLSNCGDQIKDYIEGTYLILEEFEWFKDNPTPKITAYMKTRGYESLQVTFAPGRHYCRVWVHSKLQWHLMMCSADNIQLGMRDEAMVAAMEQCPWIDQYLTGIAIAFSNWIGTTKTTESFAQLDKEFMNSYQPDLPWRDEISGFKRKYIHWMFKQALGRVLRQKMAPLDLFDINRVMRILLHDPEFGLADKNPDLPTREFISKYPCDCSTTYDEVEITEDKLQKGDNATIKPNLSDRILEHIMNPVNLEGVSRICEVATEEISCEYLKKERYKIIKRHEAATVIQAYWRGTRVRIYLRSQYPPEIPSNVMKNMMDCAFGSVDALASVMNEFFRMFPSVKYAYSISSGLGGCDLKQYTGSVQVTKNCRWVPLFRGLFFCHSPVKVHFALTVKDVNHRTYAVFDNDSLLPMPQNFNAHKTFDITPNVSGYTVIGHGILNEVKSDFEAEWKFTVLSSMADVFHICDDNAEEICKIAPLLPSLKFRITEIYVPNKRQILGGVLISVGKTESVTLRVVASDPKLEMIAVLRSQPSEDILEDISNCSGKGELFWPFIKLEQFPPLEKEESLPLPKSLSSTLKHRKTNSSHTSRRKLPSAKGSLASAPDAKIEPVIDYRHYVIDIIACNGWDLTEYQWRKALDLLNNNVTTLEQSPPKSKGAKITKTERSRTATPKAADAVDLTDKDAFIEIEVAYSMGSGVSVIRDESRKQDLLNAIKSWNLIDADRGTKCGSVREDFLKENVLTDPPPEPHGSLQGIPDSNMPPEPTRSSERPVDATIHEVLIEMEESENEEIAVETEPVYRNIPPQLLDELIPMDFLDECVKLLKEEEPRYIDADEAEQLAEARQEERDYDESRAQAFDEYNQRHVLAGQQRRARHVDNMQIGAAWKPSLEAAFIARDEAREVQAKALGATKAPPSKQGSAKKNGSPKASSKKDASTKKSAKKKK